MDKATIKLRDRIFSIGLSSLSPSEDPISLIGYCCDVEGNLQYWENYLSISLVLRRRNSVLELRDNCHFVFGGDACDRGVGDIRVIRDLAGLLERYPGRVHLIMGNRDINKLRMKFELSEHTLNNSLGNVYWAPKVPITGHTPAEKLKWMLLNTLGCPLTFELRRQELAALGDRALADVDDGAVVQSFLDLVAPDGALTKYLLGAKLGTVVGDVCFCHGAISASSIGKVPPSADEAGRVCPTSSTAPAAADRDSSDISADLMTEPLSGLWTLEGWRQCSGSVQEWYEQLNAFARKEMQHYQSTCEDYLTRMTSGEFDQPSPLPSPPTTPRLATSLSYSTTHTAATTSVCSVDEGGDDLRSGGAYWALVGGYCHPQPGSRLLQYGMGWMPDKAKNPSIVYENWLNDMGEPSLPDPKVTEYLRRSGIRFTVTGHQPHGDAPLVMATRDVVYVAADTSYSTNVKWGDGDQTFAEQSKAAGVDSSPGCVCAAEDRTSFLPAYDAVIDAGVTRGLSVSEVCFELNRGSTVLAFTHGVLSNNMRYAFPIQHRHTEIGDLYSNQDIDPEWWIKGFVFSPSEMISSEEKDCGINNAYLVCKSAKFSVENKFVPRVVRS